MEQTLERRPMKRHPMHQPLRHRSHAPRGCSQRTPCRVAICTPRACARARGHHLCWSRHHLGNGTVPYSVRTFGRKRCDLRCCVRTVRNTAVARSVRDVVTCGNAGGAYRSERFGRKKGERTQRFPPKKAGRCRRVAPQKGIRLHTQASTSAAMRSERRTDRTLEACHCPPFAVVTPSTVSCSAMRRRDMPSACMPWILSSSASG